MFGVRCVFGVVWWVSGCLLIGSCMVCVVWCVLHLVCCVWLGV